MPKVSFSNPLLWFLYFVFTASKNHHRHQFQVQILNFVLNLLDDSDNVETLTICRHCQNHMIDILLSPIYVHFIRSSSSTNSGMYF